MEKNQFLNLVNKYLAGGASFEEEQQLIHFFDSFKPVEEWDEQVLGVKKELEEKMLQRLMQSIQQVDVSRQPKIRSITLWRSIAAAVAVFVMAGVFYFDLFNVDKPEQAGIKAAAGKQVLTPGGNKASLKLADGSTIILSTASNGVLAMQGNTAVKKTKDGQLVYTAGKPGKLLNNTLNNTITTPKGGQYQLTLPDGTKVWLNAGSSLTFPTVFASGERNVELKGEAYFEVAKVYVTAAGGPVRMPFYVKTGASQVEVLGTHFNVMAYPDSRNQETTLLEGSVLVKYGSYAQKIVPGQQVSIANNSLRTIQVKNVNTELVMAWKEGLFLFDNTNIEDAMLQIERWYNAEVVYEGSKPDVEFTGILPRSSDVSKVLNLLESAQGVKFTISGNKIIVKKK